MLATFTKMAHQSTWHNASVGTVMALFFLQPVLLGCMLVRIPDIKTAIDLNKAELAIGLIGLPVGALIMLPCAGIFAARLGVRLTLLVGFPLFLLALVSVSLATTLPALFGTCMLTGAAMAFTEMGLNLHATHIEQQQGKLIMSKAHGCWSLGEMSGSIIGVILATLGVGVAAMAFVCATFVLPFALLFIWPLPREEDLLVLHDAGPPWHKLKFKRPSAALVGIGLFLFGAAMTEGAVSEWSALYLREMMGAEVAAAGYGLSLFAACLAICRFLGDWLKARLGPVLLARLSASIAVFALILVIARLNVPTVFLGFALLGAGVAVSFPLAVSAAGALKGRPSMHLAYLSFGAVLAFLAGPPLIGFIAEATDLRWGLAALLPLLLLSLVFTGALRPRPPATTS